MVRLVTLIAEDLLVGTVLSSALTTSAVLALPARVVLAMVTSHTLFITSHTFSILFHCLQRWCKGLSGLSDSSSQKWEGL